jgi:hypothetical protein
MSESRNVAASSGGHRNRSRAVVALVVVNTDVIAVATIQIELFETYTRRAQRPLIEFRRRRP